MSFSRAMARLLLAFCVPLLMLLRTSGDAAVAEAAAMAGADPQPAPREYRSANYGLTFAVPAGATYCPLPEDWYGSDHGTTIFLERPRSCGGVGYPSSSRDFEPDVARIMLYYSYWMDEDEPPEPACNRIATIRFLGEDRPVCETREEGLVMRSVGARYMADSEAKAYLTLVTRPDRLEADMAVFASAAASMRTCTSTHLGSNDQPFTIGTGAPCPASAVWF